MASSSPTNSVPKSGWLDRPLPLVVYVVLVLLCASIPTAYVAKQYVKRPDLTQLIFFGQKFLGRGLPEIRALSPESDSVDGYDGQFYAQLALDPGLQRPELQGALDKPAYRSQRIFLPTLAYILGLGSPAAILRAYALLNLAFWYVLFAALLWWVRSTSGRSLLVVFAIVLTTGALISIERSLTDLPAATFGFLSLCLEDLPAVAMISLAILTKPTSGLFLTRYLLPLPKSLAEGMRRFGMIFLVMIPPILWIFYIFHVLPVPIADENGNFAYPLWDEVKKFAFNWRNLTNCPLDFQLLAVTQWEWDLFELLALISMTFQAVFLLVYPRWRHPAWIMGIGFAVLFFFLNQIIFIEQISHARTALPLTIAFNLLLLDIKRGPLFFLYFFVGNVGLVCVLHDMVGFLFRS